MKSDAARPKTTESSRKPSGPARSPPGRPDTIVRASAASATARKERLALVALAAMALVWGYNWVVMKQVLAFIGPFDFSALRNLLGAAVLLAALLLSRRPMRIHAWPRVVLLGLLQTALFAALVQVALMSGGAGKTSLLVFTMPFWVIPMAWVAFGERIRGLQWLALALAAAGLLLVLEPWQAQGDFLSESLAVGAGACWALAIVVAKWIRRDYPADVLALTTWQMVFGALALCVLAWLVPEKPVVPTLYFYGALFYNAVIATALAWFLWLFALQHLSAGVAGMAILGVPVVSVLAGWLELGEQPGATELAGMLLMGAALLVVSLRAMGKRA